MDFDGYLFLAYIVQNHFMDILICLKNLVFKLLTHPPAQIQYETDINSRHIQI